MYLKAAVIPATEAAQRNSFLQEPIQLCENMKEAEIDFQFLSSDSIVSRVQQFISTSLVEFFLFLGIVQCPILSNAIPELEVSLSNVRFQALTTHVKYIIFSKLHSPLEWPDQ
jgi:hypothetical protein